jgi:hypothetical protein
VRRRLRIGVPEGDALVVFVHDVGRDFAIDDFLEDGFRHGGAWVLRWVEVTVIGS